MQPNNDLNGKEWTEGKQFPIGFSDSGDFSYKDQMSEGLETNPIWMTQLD